MTIEIRREFYDDCRIYSSISKWYHWALFESDLCWKKFIEAIESLEQILELHEKELYKFNISKIEVGLGAKKHYDSTYVKTQIIEFKLSYYKIRDFEGYQKFTTKTQDRIAKIYDKKTEIRKKIGLIKALKRTSLLNEPRTWIYFAQNLPFKKAKQM